MNVSSVAEVVKDDYNQLKKECARWVDSETHVHSVCVLSLIKGDMKEVNSGDIAENFSGRALFEKIKALGSSFSDRAASELATQLTNSGMLPSESIIT